MYRNVAWSPWARDSDNQHLSVGPILASNQCLHRYSRRGCEDRQRGYKAAPQSRAWRIIQVILHVLLTVRVGS